MLPFLASDAKFVPLPDDLRTLFSPAQFGLYEWTDYFFHWPGADNLRVNDRSVAPLAPGVFRVHWENALGLVRLQPERDGQSLEAPLWAEILSPKFPTPEEHASLLRTVLGDLWQRAAFLPWSESGDTFRSHRTSRRAPSALQTLDWARRYGTELQRIFARLEAQPLRRMEARRHDVAPSHVHEMGASAFMALAQDATRWAAVPRLIPGAHPATGNGTAILERRPHRVPQIIRVESLDTPTNRRAVLLARRVSEGLRRAATSAWWLAMPAEARKIATRSAQTCDALLARLGHLPNSPVEIPPRSDLERRIQTLDAELCGPGEPVLAPLERFARVRDVSALWEFWAFFALVEAIENSRGEKARLEARFDAERGLLAPSRAYFSGATLVFNGPAPSYSTPLRPDFLWFVDNKAVAAFDAKFRLEADNGHGRGTDLHKMHAYRDALGVGAAVALYPGSQTTFFDRERGPLSRLPFAAILEGVAEGVGWWAKRPF